MVPGKTEPGECVILGFVEKGDLHIETFTPDLIPEKARFCKNGNHFMVGQDGYIALEVSQKETNDINCFKTCSLIFWGMCSGSATRALTYTTRYVKVENLPKLEKKLEYEEKIDFVKKWSCCFQSNFEKRKILVKKNDTVGEPVQVVGGIRYADRGSRICCGVPLMGLDGDQKGLWSAQAQAFVGPDPGDEVKSPFAVFPYTGMGFESCGCGSLLSCPCRCMALCLGCKNFNCGRKPKAAVNAAISASNCVHKPSSWAAKVPGPDGKGHSGIFWQAKGPDAEPATAFARPVCILGNSTEEALVHLALMPHAHSQQASYLFKAGDRRSELLPDEREGYGLGWSDAFLNRWKCNPYDAQRDTMDLPAQEIMEVKDGAPKMKMNRSSV